MSSRRDCSTSNNKELRVDRRCANCKNLNCHFSACCSLFFLSFDKIYSCFPQLPEQPQEIFCVAKKIQGHFQLLDWKVNKSQNIIVKLKACKFEVYIFNIYMQGPCLKTAVIYAIRCFFLLETLTRTMSVISQVFPLRSAFESESFKITAFQP